MGKAYKKGGRKDYAVQALRQAAKLRPDDSEIKSLLNQLKVK
jgi:cytochrome c-type biogenesis protein CcmH/NrfG